MEQEARRLREEQRGLKRKLEKVQQTEKRRKRSDSWLRNLFLVYAWVTVGNWEYAALMLRRSSVRSALRGLSDEEPQEQAYKLLDFTPSVTRLPGSET
mgnify:CR=1 FL=1